MLRAAAIVALVAVLPGTLAASKAVVLSDSSRRRTVASLLAGEPETTAAHLGDEMRFRYFPYTAPIPSMSMPFTRHTTAAALYGGQPVGGSADYAAGHAAGVASGAAVTAQMVGAHPGVAAAAAGAMVPPPAVAALPQWVGPVYPSAHAYFQPYGAHVPGYYGQAMVPYTPAYGAYASAVWSDYRMCSNAGIPPEGTPEFPYPDVDGEKAKRKLRRSLMIGQPVGTFAFRKGVQPNTIEADAVSGQHQGGISMITTYTFKCIGGAGVGRLESMDGLGTRSTVQEWIASKPSLFRYPLGDQPAVPEGHASLVASGYPGFVHGFAQAPAMRFRQKGEEAPQESAKALPRMREHTSATSAAASKAGAHAGFMPGMGAPMMPGMVHPYLMHSGVAAYAHGMLPGHAVTRDPLTGEDFDATPIAAERGARLAHWGPYGVYSPSSPLMLNSIHTSYLHPAYSTGFLHPANVFYHPAHWAGMAHPAARLHALHHWTHPYAAGYMMPPYYGGYGGMMTGGYGGMMTGGYGGMMTPNYGAYGPAAMAYGFKQNKGIPAPQVEDEQAVSNRATPRFRQADGENKEPAAPGPAATGADAAATDAAASTATGSGTPLVNPGDNTAQDTGSSAARTAAEAELTGDAAAAARAAGAANTVASGGFAPPVLAGSSPLLHPLAPPVLPGTGMFVHPPIAGGAAIGFPYDVGYGAAPSPHDPWLWPVHPMDLSHPLHPMHAVSPLHPMHPSVAYMPGRGFPMGYGFATAGLHVPASPYFYMAPHLGYQPHMGPWLPWVHPDAALAQAHATIASHAAQTAALDADAHALAGAMHMQAANLADMHARAAAGSAAHAMHSAAAIHGATMAAAAASSPYMIMLQRKAERRDNTPAAAATATTTTTTTTTTEGLPASKAARSGRHLRRQQRSAPEAAAGAVQAGSPRFAERASARYYGGGGEGSPAMHAFSGASWHPYLPYHQAAFGTYFPHAGIAAQPYNPFNPMYSARHSGMYGWGFPHTMSHLHAAHSLGLGYGAGLHGYHAMGTGLHAAGMYGGLPYLPHTYHPSYLHAGGYMGGHYGHFANGMLAAGYGSPASPFGLHHGGMYGLGHYNHYGGVYGASYGPLSPFHYPTPLMNSYGSWLQTGAKALRTGAVAKAQASTRAAAKALATHATAAKALVAGRAAVMAGALADPAPPKQPEAGAAPPANQQPLQTPTDRASNQQMTGAAAAPMGAVAAPIMMPAMHPMGFYGAYPHPYMHPAAAAANAAYFGPPLVNTGMMMGMPHPWATLPFHSAAAMHAMMPPMHPYLHAMHAHGALSVGYMHPMHPYPFAAYSAHMPYATLHPFAHAYSPYAAGQYHPYQHPMFPYGPGSIPAPHQSVLSSLAMGQMYAMCRATNLPPSSPTPDFPFYNRHASEAKYIHEQLLPGLPVGTYAVRMDVAGDGVAVDVNVPLDKANPTNMGPTRVAHYKFRCEGNQLVDAVDPARSYYSLESLTDSIPILQNPLGSIVPETMHIAASGLPVTPAMLEHLRQTGIVNEQVKKANSGQIGSGIIY